MGHDPPGSGSGTSEGVQTELKEQAVPTDGGARLRGRRRRIEAADTDIADTMGKHLDHEHKGPGHENEESDISHSVESMADITHDMGMLENSNGHMAPIEEEFVHPRRPISEGIYTMSGPHEMVDELPDVPWLAPAWQIHPLIGNEGRLLYNEYNDRQRQRAIDTMLATNRPAMTEVLIGKHESHLWINILVHDEVRRHDFSIDF